MINGTNSGSANEPNEAMVQKRIRLSLKDIKIINEALRKYDMLPESEKIHKWADYHDLKRRFSCLAENDGYYARRSRW